MIRIGTTGIGILGLFAQPAPGQVPNPPVAPAVPTKTEAAVTTTSAVKTINNLTKIADALTAGVTSLTGLTNGLGPGITTIASTWNAISAKRMSTRLNKIYGLTNRLSVAQNDMLTNVDAYVDQWEKSSKDGLDKNETKQMKAGWSIVRRELKSVIEMVVDLDGEMKGEGSPWVRDASFARLSAGIQSRRSLLKNGALDVAAPLSGVEIDALKQVGKRYRDLHIQLESAIQELQRYLDARDAQKQS